MRLMLRLDIANAILNRATSHPVVHFRQPAAAFDSSVLVKLSRRWPQSLFDLSGEQA
jgi:hypothetical protein